MVLDRRDPHSPGKYILNLKLTKNCQRKLSGWLVCDSGRLDLTLITEQVGLSYVGRHLGVYVSKQAYKQASKWVLK